MSGPTSDAPTSPCECGAFQWAPPVTVIVLDVPGLKYAFPIIPEWGTLYFPCLACKGLRRMVERAVEGSETLKGRRWDRALVVCQGTVIGVENVAEPAPARA